MFNKKQDKYELDMSQIIDYGTKSMIKRNTGRLDRKLLKLDKLEKTYKQIIITIPDNIETIETSYLIGFLGKSIIKMGEDKFSKKYKFVCSKEIMFFLKVNIKYILKNAEWIKECENI